MGEIDYKTEMEQIFQKHDDSIVEIKRRFLNQCKSIEDLIKKDMKAEQVIIGLQSDLATTQSRLQNLTQTFSKERDAYEEQLASTQKRLGEAVKLLNRKPVRIVFDEDEGKFRCSYCGYLFGEDDFSDIDKCINPKCEYNLFFATIDKGEEGDAVTK